MVANIAQFKTAPPITERKSAIGDISFPEFLHNRGFTDLSAFAALVLYRRAMPLFNAVDKRATYFSQIPVRVKDKEGKLVNDHPSIELLQKPNADLTQNEFLYQISSYLDITGNCFILATGRVNAPPIELITIAPHHVTFGFSKGALGFLNVPETIMITESGIGQVTFTAEEVDDGVRYYDSTQTKELWHIRQFNPFRGSANFWGMSKALPVWLELQNYISGNNTNWSMLKRGTRLSMAWVNSTGVPLTNDQWERMQEEAQKYQGDLNAGGTPVIDGMDVKNIQQTNRDMEFKDLQESMMLRISTVYGIPLALLIPTAMTMNNLETSELQLYDNSVIPLTNYLDAELTSLLMSRYQTPELRYTFSPHDIPVLQSRIIINVDKQSKIGVNTDNEIRTLLGDEEVNGGDVIWKPSNLVPVGEDTFTEDNLEKPARIKFINYMMRYKNEDGSIRYSKAELELMADERGL